MSYNRLITWLGGEINLLSVVLLVVALVLTAGMLLSTISYKVCSGWIAGVRRLNCLRGYGRSDEK